MTTEELKNNFIQTIAIWENALLNYSDEQLLIKENEDSWSVGQVYDHLITMTRQILILTEKIKQVNDNSHEEKTPAGVISFKHNSLGVKKIHSPVNTTSPPTELDNKALIAKDLVYIKKRFFELCDETSATLYNGKHNHAVLGFLNAKEWLQFIDMHFRHHLSQLENINNFINSAHTKQL